MKNNQFEYLKNENIITDFYDMDKEKFLVAYKFSESEYDTLVKEIESITRIIFKKHNNTLDILLSAKSHISKEKRICEKNDVNAYKEISNGKILTENDIYHISALDSSLIYYQEAENNIQKIISNYIHAYGLTHQEEISWNLLTSKK